MPEINRLNIEQSDFQILGNLQTGDIYDEDGSFKGKYYQPRDFIANDLKRWKNTCNDEHNCQAQLNFNGL